MKAIRMIGPRGVLPSGQIEGLVNGAAHVSSNSWGGIDFKFDGPSTQIKEAFRRGVTAVSFLFVKIILLMIKYRCTCATI